MAQGTAIQSAWKVIPQLQSRNLQASIEFYSVKLGFAIGGVHTDEGTNDPIFASVYAGNKAVANIYLSQLAEEVQSGVITGSTIWIALGTEQVDNFYARLKSDRDVMIAEDISDKLWGYRQFAVKDPDGHRLIFFKFLEGGNPGTTTDDKGSKP